MAKYSVDTWAFYGRKSMDVFRVSGGVSFFLVQQLNMVYI